MSGRYNYVKGTNVNTSGSDGIEYADELPPSTQAEEREPEDNKHNQRVGELDNIRGVEQPEPVGYWHRIKEVGYSRMIEGVLTEEDRQKIVGLNGHECDFLFTHPTHPTKPDVRMREALEEHRKEVERVYIANATSPAKRDLRLLYDGAYGLVQIARTALEEKTE